MLITLPRKASVFLNHFNQTLHNAGVLIEGGDPVEPLKDQHGYLPTRILQSILTMRTSLGEVIDTKSRLTAEDKKAGRALQQTKERLQKTVRNFWSEIRLRVSRDGLPESVFSSYGMTAKGNNPADLSRSLWPVYAEKLLKGEAEIAALGHEPTAAAIVDGIRQVLDAFTAGRAAKNKTQTALTTYNQENFQPLMIEARRLYRQMMTELRQQLEAYDAPERRQIMRQYGAEFIAAEGETLETEPPTDGGETTETPNTDGGTTDPPANDSASAEPAA